MLGAERRLALAPEEREWVAYHEAGHGLLALSGPNEEAALDAGVGGRDVRPYGERLADAVDQATRRIVDECYRKALDLLTRERARLDALATALPQAESLSEARMLAVPGQPGRAVPDSPIAASR